MPDLEFDVVIVGGGCKGLSTGVYMAKYGGLSVGIFEETYELGGGLAGDQIAPGIQCNTHAGGHQWWYYDTIIKEDFPELFEEGLNLLPVGSNVVVGFDDESCLALYGTQLDPDSTRSAAEIARFSEKDADTYLRLRKLYDEYVQDAIIEEAFSVPPPVGTPGAVAKAFAKMLKDHPDLSAMSGGGLLDVVSAFYESTEARMMMLLQGSFLIVTGVSDIAAVMGIFGMFNYHFEDGGAHNLAHALHRVLHKYGAKTYTHSQVKRTVIENGKATGIELADGTRVNAKVAVISTLSPAQLTHDLIGTENLSGDFVKKIDGLESSGLCTTLITYAFAEPPQFKCRSFNPSVYDKEMQRGVNFVNFAPKSIDAAMGMFAAGVHLKTPGSVVPKGQIISMNTDPIDSHICNDKEAVTWNLLDFAPPAWAQTPEYWRTFANEFPDWQIKHLSKYVDGADWDNIVGCLVRTPYWIAQHFKNMGPSGNVNIIDTIPSQVGSYRPIPELAQHRTPVPGLYATGSAFGSWGMSSFCSAYTCYRIMAEDLGLRKPWEEKGRAY